MAPAPPALTVWAATMLGAPRAAGPVASGVVVVGAAVVVTAAAAAAVVDVTTPDEAVCLLLLPPPEQAATTEASPRAPTASHGRRRACWMSMDTVFWAV